MVNISQNQQKQTVPETGKSKSRYVYYILAAIAVIAGGYLISRHNYPLFHSFADGITALIATGVFILVWNRRRLLDNQYYLFIGIAFLFFAFWDFLHILGNKGMGVFPQYGNLGPTFYIVSRYFLAISMLSAPLFIRRKLNTAIIFAVYSAASILLLLSIFHWRNFPVTYIEGAGLTSFKVISDYIICAVLLAALILLVLNRQSLDVRVFRLATYSFVLFIATGLAFTLYTDPFGATNALGHFFQIASFYLVYNAFISTLLIKPQDILYRNLQQSKDEATKLNVELDEEIRKKEEELRVAKQIEQLKDEFIGMVSHELKTPLTVIIGALDVAKEKGMRLNEIRGLIHDAGNSAESLAAMVDNLLELSRHQSNRLNLQTAQTSIEPAIKAVINKLKDRSSKHQLIGDISPVLPNVLMDPIRVERVLNNLVENAIKYSPDGGEIKISVHQADSHLVASVSDQGIGISPENQQKLFQKFERLDIQKKYEIGGVGLGLRVCQILVELHGGRIWVESEQGKGSTFFFTLPVSQIN